MFIQSYPAKIVFAYILSECIILLFTVKEEEEYPALWAALRYRVLSGDSLESPTFFLQLLLVIALGRRPAWCRVSPLNHLSSAYTLTNHKGEGVSHVISMHRPG
jgi:hypothetical protein